MSMETLFFFFLFLLLVVATRFCRRRRRRFHDSIIYLFLFRSLRVMLKNKTIEQEAKFIIIIIIVR